MHASRVKSLAAPLLASGFVSLGWASLAWAAPGLQLPPYLDAGTHVQGERVDLQVPVQNTGDRPLLINSVTTDCSCLHARLPGTALAPGQERTLVVWADIAPGARPGLISVLVVSTIILVFAYARRVWWFTKTTYLSWIALDTWRPRKERGPRSLEGGDPTT